MNKNKVQLLMLIGMYVAILIFILTVIVLVKNINLIKKNPISYGIEEKDLIFCSCYDDRGNSYDYDKDGLRKEEVGGLNLYLDD